MAKYFYLYKMGIYGHGVFWIGTDYEEGKRQADIHATQDRDDYHDWQIHEYNEGNLTCDETLLYTGKRVKESD